jgi:protocatechuate 3,4-dioxygenase beta subunit
MLAGIGLVVGAAGYVTGSKDPGGTNAAQPPVPRPPAGPVHVRVVDRDGKPVAGTKVQVFRMFETPLVVSSDDAGRLTVARDDADRFVARQGDTLGWAVLDRSRELQPPDRQGPAGTADDPLIVTLRPLSHRVRGTVVDPAGKPVAGVRVAVESIGRPGAAGAFLYRAENEAAGWPFGTAVTDGAGRYALDLPEGDRASFEPADPRYAGPRFWPRDVNADTVDPVTLQPAGRISGTVADADTGAPVAGARVGAQLLDHVRGEAISGTYGDAISDARGRYTIGGLNPGVFNVHLWKVPGRERAAARAREFVRVRAGRDTPADLAVIEGRPLRGVVVDAKTDRPAAGVQVDCYGPAHPQSGAAVQATRTDEDGRFTFYVPPGPQHVYVMDGAITRSRLSSADPRVPEAGEAEPVRLVRITEPPRRPAWPAVKKAFSKRAVTKTEQGKKPPPDEPPPPAPH